MNNSAEKIGNNEDILTEILLRLPTKSLLKFKCVSKQWLFLISNPQFCLCHTRHHQDNGFLEPTGLLLKVNLTTIPRFDVVPLKHYSKVPLFHYVNAREINIMQSCNGLFLCECFGVDGVRAFRHFICNPTTKKFKMLSFPRKPLKDCEFYVNLAFDPLKSPHYKIISIREVSPDSDKFEMDIYSSARDSWNVSRISFEVDDGEYISFRDVIFCNGMIYWRNNCGNQSLRFDVEKECLQKVPMPTIRGDAIRNYKYFGEARGILYLVVTYSEEAYLELDVYEMARDNSRWFLKHHLDLGDVMKVLPEINLGCLPDSSGFSGVCFIRSEKEEEPKMVVWADGKIIAYDFNDGAWKMLYDPGPGVKVGSFYSKIYSHLHHQRFVAYKYFENLSWI